MRSIATSVFRLGVIVICETRKTTAWESLVNGDRGRQGRVGLSRGSWPYCGQETGRIGERGPRFLPALRLLVHPRLSPPRGETQTASPSATDDIGDWARCSAGETAPARIHEWMPRFGRGGVLSVADAHLRLSRPSPWKSFSRYFACWRKASGPRRVLPQRLSGVEGLGPPFANEGPSPSSSRESRLRRALEPDARLTAHVGSGEPCPPSGPETKPRLDRGERIPTRETTDPLTRKEDERGGAAKGGGVQSRVRRRAQESLRDSGAPPRRPSHRLSRSKRQRRPRLPSCLRTGQAPSSGKEEEGTRRPRPQESPRARAGPFSRGWRMFPSPTPDVRHPGTRDFGLHQAPARTVLDRVPSGHDSLFREPGPCRGPSKRFVVEGKGGGGTDARLLGRLAQSLFCPLPDGELTRSGGGLTGVLARKKRARAY